MDNEIKEIINELYKMGYLPIQLLGKSDKELQELYSITKDGWKDKTNEV